MDDPLIIEKTETTPEVIFDKENNVFQISGRSILENSHEFYLPIREWITEYLKIPNTETELTLNFEYLNSSSSLQLMKIIYLFEKHSNMKTKIKWLFEKNDEMLKERGEEFQSMTDLEFELMEFKDPLFDDDEDFSFDF